MKKIKVEIEIPEGNCECCDCKLPLCEFGVNCCGYNTHDLNIISTEEINEK